MFGLFKKKQQQVALYAVCDGTFKPIEKVNDAVFADKIMGDGFAITPVSGKVKINSPIKGKVMSIFPTKHAITFLTDEGVEGLVHMGIDTVAFKGEGFDIHVQEGQTVDQNTLLAEMDVDFILKQNKNSDVIVVFTNLGEDKKLIISLSGEVQQSSSIGHITL